MNNLKQRFLKVKNINDLGKIDDETITEYRNNMYHELLKDKEFVEHFTKTFDVKEELLPFLFMIDGKPPLENIDFEIDNTE